MESLAEPPLPPVEAQLGHRTGSPPPAESEDLAPVAAAPVTPVAGPSTRAGGASPAAAPADAPPADAPRAPSRHWAGAYRLLGSYFLSTGLLCVLVPRLASWRGRVCPTQRNIHFARACVKLPIALPLPQYRAAPPQPPVPICLRRRLPPSCSPQPRAPWTLSMTPCCACWVVASWRPPPLPPRSRRTARRAPACAVQARRPTTVPSLPLSLSTNILCSPIHARLLAPPRLPPHRPDLLALALAATGLGASLAFIRHAPALAILPLELATHGAAWLVPAADLAARGGGGGALRVRERGEGARPCLAPAPPAPYDPAQA